MCSHSPPRLLQNRPGIRRREFACPTFIGPERAAGDIEMRKDRNRLALAMVLLASGVLHCAAQPYATGAHIDTEYDFSKVKTFAFALVPQKPLNSDNGKLLRDARANRLDVLDELQSIGFGHGLEYLRRRMEGGARLRRRNGRTPTAPCSTGLRNVAHPRCRGLERVLAWILIVPDRFQHG